MPSLRHNSAMLSSPRRPAITMRIFSSAEYCRRVARRISRIRFSASSESVSAFVLIARSFAVKMSSKSSLPQSLTSVQLVLTGNSRTQRGALGKNDGGIRDLEKIRFESISGSDAVYLTDLRARSAQAHDYSSLNANLRGRCNWL